MGNGNCRRVGKFYEEQVGRVRSLLERIVKEQDSKFDLDKYLLLCEQLGEEPDPAKMPLGLSEFPEEVQVAFFVFGLLPDHYEGMTGTYMGKYWDGIDYYFKLFEVEEPKQVEEDKPEQNDPVKKVSAFAKPNTKKKKKKKSF